MKVLIVNKFLFPNGGSEAYIFKLGNYLKTRGCEVQYFGMEDDKNIVGNMAKSYTRNIDLRRNNKGIYFKIKSLFSVVYSFEARKKIKIVLEQFKPDIVHLNNINFQITPSIIYEIRKHRLPIVQTVHDTQIACPNHRLYIEETGVICDKCLNGSYLNCIKYRCVHNSRLKSIIAAFESFYYHWRNTYNLVDMYICPSNFISDIIHLGGVQQHRTKVMHNFSDQSDILPQLINKGTFVLYFGRLSKEKGIETLFSVCKELPEIRFVIAGDGPLAVSINYLPNVEYVGFKQGEELQLLIRQAAFTIYPSECYENCPLSVIESLALGTPVIGSDLGGIKELIEHEKTGLLFRGGNKESLKASINRLWEDKELLGNMYNSCLNRKMSTIDLYTENLIDIYQSLINKYK